MTDILKGPLRAPAQMLQEQSYGGHKSLHDDAEAERLGGVLQKSIAGLPLGDAEQLGEVGMIIGQHIRHLISEQAFRRVFFCCLLALGGYIASSAVLDFTA